jgi:hypothetical protein
MGAGNPWEIDDNAPYDKEAEKKAAEKAKEEREKKS